MNRKPLFFSSLCDFCLSGIFVLAVGFFPRFTQAAACCGGGSAAPTVLTGDDRAQFSASFSQSQVIGDASASRVYDFRADGDNERSQTLKIEGAYLLTDRWQVGASLPFIRKSRNTPATSSSESGLGDVGLSGAYEILPEWEYSVWKPRGFFFTQALVPTGGSLPQSSFDTTDPWQLDARGHGFYALGGGVIFLKNWGDWDLSLMSEAHRSLPRTFTTPEGDLRLIPGWGGSAAISAGYNLNRWPLRFGLTLSPSIESSIRTEGESGDSSSYSQLVWNTTAQVGWMVGRDVTISALYTDQTLIGPASNTSLSRSLSLLFQKRWER